MSKIAIVIGSTGLVGAELVRQLVQHSGYAQVICLARRRLNLNSPKLTQHIVNFDHIDDWQSLIQGDELFCCMGTTLKQAGSKQRQTQVDLDYPKQVADFAVNNGVSTAILVSSSAANRNSNSFYLRLKGQLERAYSEAGFDKLIIVRPSILTGERAQFRLGEKVGEWLLNGLKFLPYIKKYRPISGHQVAKSMINLANNSETSVTKSLDQLFD